MKDEQERIAKERGESLPLPGRIDLDSRTAASHELRPRDVPRLHWSSVVEAMSWVEHEFAVRVDISGNWVFLELEPWGRTKENWVPIGQVHVSLDWNGTVHKQGEGFIDRFEIKARSILRGLTIPEVTRATLSPYGDLKWKVCRGRCLCLCCVMWFRRFLV